MRPHGTVRNSIISRALIPNEHVSVEGRAAIIGTIGSEAARARNAPIGGIHRKGRKRDEQEGHVDRGRLRTEEQHERLHQLNDDEQHKGETAIAQQLSFASRELALALTDDVLFNLSPRLHNQPSRSRLD